MTAHPGYARGAERPPLRVVDVARPRRVPRLRGWILLTLTVVAAFFLLIYSRITLDHSAFVLEEVEQRLQEAESRYWELRLEVAELRSPDRITELAQEIGLVYPSEVHTVEASRIVPSSGDADDRWAELKALLSAQP
jgi:cell division protein FtsL